MILILNLRKLWHFFYFKDNFGLANLIYKKFGQKIKLNTHATAKQMKLSELDVSKIIIKMKSIEGLSHDSQFTFNIYL